jgi:choline-glycine betaine transporter
MELLVFIYLIGYIIATAMVFVSSKSQSDDAVERLFGSLILGLLSWIYIAIVSIVQIITRKSGKGGKR